MAAKPPRFRFETERLKTGPMSYEISQAPGVFDLLEDPEYRFEDPITGTLKLTLVGDTVVMQGAIATVATACCGRCLETIRIPLRAEVVLAFIHDERLLDREAHPELDEENTHYFDGECVYPMEQLRELLLLELPLIPACELDPGDLCPVSGKQMGTRVFGPAEEKTGREEAGNTLHDQVEELRRKLQG